jgi:hypothetical protein
MPFAPAYAAPAFGYAGSAYGMTPYGGYGTTVFGADPVPPQKSFLDKTKDFMNEKTGPLPNYGWLGLALVGGAAWYYTSARRR